MHRRKTRKSIKRRRSTVKRRTSRGGNNTNFKVMYNGLLIQGQQIAKELTQTRPEIGFISQPGLQYTILMWDPDAPIKPSYIHFIATNIEREGEIYEKSVLSYTPPNPPSGIHRYFFGLFEQQSKEIHPDIPAERGGFDYNKFIVSNKLKKIGEVMMRVSY